MILLYSFYLQQHNRMAIMPHDMSPRLRDIPAVLDGAVTTHILMITDALPALGAMVRIDLRNGVMLMRHNPIAVNDDHCNPSHRHEVAPRAVRMAARILMSV